MRQYVRERPLHVVQDVARGEAERSVALGHQPFVPSLIASRNAAPVMRLSVDFNRKPGRNAYEVEHERSGRMLPPPLQAAGSFAQFPPEQDFRQAHLSSKSARGSDRRSRTRQHRASPSTLLRTVPLPVPGRIFARSRLICNRVAAALLALILLFAATPAAADERSDRREILAAVQGLFDALAARDPQAAMALVVPEGTIAAHISRDGVSRLRAQRWQAWADGLTEGTERLEERMYGPRVRIRGNMASVWTYYTFYRDGAFSHCGIDLFDMARVDGRWLILNLSFTMEREGCRRR